MNLTATDTIGPGWLSLFPNGTPWPGTTTINWSTTGTNIANSTIVKLDSLQRVRVRAAGSTHFLIDVQGFL